MMLQNFRLRSCIPALLVSSFITSGSTKEVYVGPGTAYTSIGAALGQFYPLTEDLEVRVIVPSGIYSEPEDIAPTASQLDGHSIYIDATTDVPSATYYVEDEAVFQGIVNVSLVYENITGINGKEGRIAAGSPKFLIKDHLGSTRETIDETGASVDRTAYYSYGRMNKLVTSQAASREKFTEKEFDEDEGVDLYYFGARYLDPEIGLWIGPDPMGQFASPYAYSPNPINIIDPDGLETVGFGDITVNGKTEQGSAWSKWFSSPMSVSVLGLEKPNFDAINERLQGELYRIAPGAALNGLGANPAGTLTSGVRALNYARVSNAANDVLHITFSSQGAMGHGARHLIGTGLARGAVESAIQAEIQTVAKGAEIGGNFYGRVMVQGQRIEFRASPRGNGWIDVGTYYPK